MPLRILKTLENKARVGVWEMTEPLSYFSGKYKPSEQERPLFDGVPEKKALERYCSRHMLQILKGTRMHVPCFRDAFGKPHLSGSDAEMTISHSGPYIAVAIHHHPVGIDIQVIHPKILRIREKFLSAAETRILDSQPRLYPLHFIWGAKEAMYKAYGKRGLRFAEHMGVSDLERFPEAGVLHGFLEGPEKKMQFQLRHRIVGSAMLVMATEKEKT